MNSAASTLREPSPTRHTYQGKGTADSPYVVAFAHPSDPLNPRDWSTSYRWFCSVLAALSMFMCSFATSAWVGGYDGLTAKWGSSRMLNTAGLSLFLLGLAAGSLLWAPLSEIYGRSRIAVGTLVAFALFGMGVCVSQSLAAAIACRFFMGVFGASVMSNSPGVLSDVWRPSEASLPMTTVSIMPLLGPILGPVISGFMSQYAGPQAWRWINAVVALFGAVTVLTSLYLIPETYAPFILRRRAAELAKETGYHYTTVFDVGQIRLSLLPTLRVYCARPFVFLFLEPIVFLLSLWTAVVFGILYLFFQAYPIMFRKQRGWSEGVAGLPFIGIAIGLFIGLPVSRLTNRMYLRAIARSEDGRAPPEERLWFAMIAAPLIPISLFWMAWTSGSSVHWMASTAAGVPFGLGIIGCINSTILYLSDTYTIYAASCFSANAVFRYCAGAGLPLAGSMFTKLGLPWAISLLGFLALACAPLPFLFFKYGSLIRAFSKHVPVVPVPLPPAPAAVEGREKELGENGKLPVEPAMFFTPGEDGVRAEAIQDGMDVVDLEKGREAL